MQFHIPHRGGICFFKCDLSCLDYDDDDDDVVEKRSGSSV